MLDLQYNLMKWFVNNVKQSNNRLIDDVTLSQYTIHNFELYYGKYDNSIGYRMLKNFDNMNDL